MKAFVVLGLAAGVLAQSGPPSGCSSSSPNSFQITTVNISSPSTKRQIEKRQVSGVLTLSLNNGILKDQAGRQGYIASNYQFQFDQPIQAGARQESGFSLCSNGSMALGGSTIFYSCSSGDFSNLYSQSTGAQCIPIHIQATNQGSGSGASQISDGQPQATSTAAPAVTQITDGQPQASKPAAPVSQISDGQPQASKPAGPAVSQISDGQPQASKPAGPVVSQISDGQPQASKPAGPVVSQISDGQPQASKPAGPVVSQISDGQPQAPAPTGNLTGNATSPPIPTFTGAAPTIAASFGGLFAGLIGLLAFF